MAPLALFANLATRWHHLHKSTSLALPHCLELPYWHHQLVLTWYLHQPESHQLSLTKRHLLTSGPNYRTPGLPGSDKKLNSKLVAVNGRSMNHAQFLFHGMYGDGWSVGADQTDFEMELW